VGALQTGDAFPNLTLDSIAGPVQLSERWSRRPLVIVFMRHFGCAFCREHLIRLTRAHDEIGATGAEVVAIFQYRIEPTKRFCESRGVPFDCLGDPSRESYEAVGLGRGERKEYIGLNVMKNWLKVARVGAVAGMPRGGDIALRSGTFVVDRTGTVRFAHYNVSSPDNPAVETILGVLAAADERQPAP
jgi:peroxiredoxin